MEIFSINLAQFHYIIIITNQRRNDSCERQRNVFHAKMRINKIVANFGILTLCNQTYNLLMMPPHGHIFVVLQLQKRLFADQYHYQSCCTIRKKQELFLFNVLATQLLHNSQTSTKQIDKQYVWSMSWTQSTRDQHEGIIIMFLSVNFNESFESVTFKTTQ